MSGTTERPTGTTTRARRRVTVFVAILSALILSAACIAVGGVAGAASGSDRTPIVATENGVVRGVAVSGGFAFRGVPYAAEREPTGHGHAAYDAVFGCHDRGPVGSPKPHRRRRRRRCRLPRGSAQPRSR